MQYKWLVVLLCICLDGTAVYAQADHPDRIPGELLVRLTDGISFATAARAEWSWPEGIRYGHNLGVRHPLVLLHFAEADLPPEQALKRVQALANVQAVQYNYRVHFRDQPNDPEYFRQWGLERMGAETVWEQTTGGTTATGTPIVVAVMDSGFDLDHEDLAPNLWHNTAEIPGDGIDNDNNGYVDDEFGWDYFSDSPNIPDGNHGLSSASVVAAKGDNGAGVAGVNWDLELMLFSFSSVADLVRAYEYTLDQRARFNESGGTEGAFVVATSNSFGQARTWCDQQPVWGEMYELMGEVGILSSSGVDNSRYDVEELGDMPATCPTEYLIISCNTDEDDNLYTTSAFGRESVDLGAPGEGSYTAKVGNNYGSYGGNSAATPHVTGAIALLYSAPCTGLEALAIEQPAAAALLMKKVLVEEGDLLPSMEGRTVSGRRLNVAGAFEELLHTCSNTLAPLALERLFPNPVKESFTVDFAVPENGVYQAELYNALGQRTRYREVPVGEVGARNFTFTTQGLPAGVYFLRFGRGDTYVTERVVVL